MSLATIVLGLLALQTHILGVAADTTTTSASSSLTTDGSLTASITTTSHTRTKTSSSSSSSSSSVPSPIATGSSSSTDATRSSKESSTLTSSITASVAAVVQPASQAPLEETSLSSLAAGPTPTSPTASVGGPSPPSSRGVDPVALGVGLGGGVLVAALVAFLAVYVYRRRSGSRRFRSGSALRTLSLDGNKERLASAWGTTNMRNSGDSPLPLAQLSSSPEPDRFAPNHAFGHVPQQPHDPHDQRDLYQQPHHEQRDPYQPPRQEQQRLLADAFPPSLQRIPSSTAQRLPNSQRVPSESKARLLELDQVPPVPPVPPLPTSFRPATATASAAAPGIVVDRIHDRFDDELYTLPRTAGGFPSTPRASRRVSSFIHQPELDQLAEPSSPLPAGSDVRMAGSARYPENHDELPIEVGETFAIIQIFEDGWAFAQSRQTQQKGFVPINFLGPKSDGQALPAVPLHMALPVPQKYVPSHVCAAEPAKSARPGGLKSDPTSLADSSQLPPPFDAFKIDDAKWWKGERESTGSDAFRMVVQSRVAESPDELTVVVGENLLMLESYTDGWGLAINQNGERGLVPLNFVSK
ncbi:uncharacterized protein BJ171DRAFT_156827 [Polychytrium aggregatum]|uniref:uncharacterized protein n=1 Tax=Polychytrium aggregatum TaxID=110093 RepID=UPI0022FEA2CA|nr:uncharacterized protein BJ171DRAFT_156827 [Polychytrium aggregatum]KAI9202923.1 hypothetical protein BJ171DRAFT_156827 [Polychytrium aggregatum]